VTDKRSLRAAAAAARAAMPASDREAARRAIRAAVLRRCQQLRVPVGARVACYQPLRTEPGSVELLTELHAAGYQVIVPHTLPDLDLDWLPWNPASDPARNPASAPAWKPGGQPSTPAGPASQPAEGSSAALGPAAIGTAHLVLVPAFAVDRAGRRLGRGGGSYDRALARVPTGTVVAALLFTGELIDRVPTDPWDRPVTAVVSPDGWQELPATGRGNA